MDLKEAVLARVDLAQLAGQYTTLTRAGREWKGRCPFHQEKTASFYVNSEKGVYHCYGCGAKGNTISFVMQSENLDFKEALDWLARRYGIETERLTQRGQPAGRKERLLAINQAAAEFFRQALAAPAGEPARAYLRKRGVGERLSADFDLGYAPKEWEALTKHLLERGYKSGEVAELGLIRARQQQGWEGQGTHIDAFRHRLIFPIRSATGRVIGFGGRALADEDNPKYLNTQNTPLYDKSATLYNLDRAKAHAREAGLVIAEGYMDVIGLAGVGIENVVACCGTALTEQHVRVLMRYGSRFYICLDSDEAGRRAAWSAGALFLRSGFDARVIELAGAKDPDEWAAAQGGNAAAAWQERLVQAQSAVGAWLEHQAVLNPGADIGKRREWVAALAGTYAALPDELIRGDFVREVASALRIGGQEAAGLLASAAARVPGAAAAAPQRVNPAQHKSALRQQAQQQALLQGAAPIEREAMRRLLDDEQFRFYFAELAAPDWFETPAFRQAAAALAGGLAPQELVHGGGELGELLASLLLGEALAEDHEHILSRLQNMYLQRRIDALQREFEAASRAGDSAKETALLREVGELRMQQRQIRTLS